MAAMSVHGSEAERAAGAPDMGMLLAFNTGNGYPV